MLNLPIHHIGVACKSIEKEWKVFEKLGFKKEDSFIDEKQGVFGEFIVPNNTLYPQYRFELLQNIGESGVLDSYLKHNAKMYHIAYQSQDIQKDLDIIKDSGIVVVPIMDASYFAKLCFVVMSNRMLIELVELKNE